MIKIPIVPGAKVRALGLGHPLLPELKGEGVVLSLLKENRSDNGWARVDWGNGNILNCQESTIYVVEMDGERFNE